ncbi:MAG: DPP IV N-terminal domain-containing protein [Bacteroidales bacterium]|nr:S9 family peptidase [Bacteroidales bacterium]MDD3130242.1 DPP IV N-terminal domain-containing protein [Bacteroidales bacterium]
MRFKNVKMAGASLLLAIILTGISGAAQEVTDSSKLSMDRIFLSSELGGDHFNQPRWIDGGESYTTLELAGGAMEIVKYNTATGLSSVLVSKTQLTPKDADSPLWIANYEWSHNRKMLLIFTNTRRVWRLNTRGDYWLLDMDSGKLTKLGKGLPASSLMFAKFSPDDSHVAYVSKHNLYVENLNSGKIVQLTSDGTDDLINGTFDWAYEEEFFCRDGFRWSPDGKTIAYWQIDASEIRDFLMINNTDSLYSFTIPVEYPKVGEAPSSARIGTVPATGGKTVWMKIPGDPYQHYLVRMHWTPDSDGFLVQQLNRKQNTNMLWYCKPKTGLAANIYTDRDEAWLDVVDDWQWVGDKYFTWLTEKDGWRHLYLISKTGDEEQLITHGDYDVVSIEAIATATNEAWFIASPHNPTQRYLYRVAMDGNGKPQRITPIDQPGTHKYTIAPDANFAFHTFSSINTPAVTELISLPDHKVVRTLVDNARLKTALEKLNLQPIEFFSVTTADSVTMEGFIIKPPDFDAAKKYPVLFHVYGEPWGQTATDQWDAASMWHRLMAQEGYLVISVDNRGTPAPKGREWRKSIYRKIGIINSRDQAMAAREIMKWPFVDSSRTAVWGWSGGGSMTLNLLFRYPEIYQTGMAVAPVSNQLFYDNIYQERYMGLKTENLDDFIKGSPLTYAKNLEGDLLIVHGTADDNVHYQNTEALINELVKHNKMFQVMPYPNRSHGIYEGINTYRHVFSLLRNYLLDHLEPGGR